MTQDGAGYNTFVGLHKAQLQHFGVPKALWEQLFEKLQAAVYDLDGTLKWDQHCPDGASVVAKQDVASESCIWLVRHTLSAPSGWQLLARLRDDLPLLLRVADDIQALSDDSEDSACNEGSACNEVHTLHHGAAAAAVAAAAVAAAAAELCTDGTTLPIPAVTVKPPACTSSSNNSSSTNTVDATDGCTLLSCSNSSSSSDCSFQDLDATGPTGVCKPPSSTQWQQVVGAANVQPHPCCSPSSRNPGMEPPLPAAECADAWAALPSVEPGQTGAGHGWQGLEEAEAGDQEGMMCGSMHAAVFSAVRERLHRHLFMFEALGLHPGGGNLRVRYMLEAVASRMHVATQPHLQLCPFMYLPTDGHDVHVLNLVWPVQALVCGAPVTRARLPLGLSDYARQEFWAETYRCETGCEEWYCGLTPGMLDMVGKHMPGLMVPSASTLVPPSSTAAAAVAAAAAERPVTEQLHAEQCVNGSSHSSSGNCGGPGAGPVPHNCCCTEHTDYVQGCSSSSSSGDGCWGGGLTALVAGCGNSTLGVQLQQLGVRRVINVDYVQEVVDMMAARYPSTQHPGLSWLHADLTQMHHLVQSNSVDLVLDKATLDGMHTADAGSSQRWSGAHLATGYLREMWRVVKPGGCLLVISLRGLASFQALLQQAQQQTAATTAQPPAPPSSCTAGGNVPSMWPQGPAAWGWAVAEHLALPGAEAHAYVCKRRP